MLGKRQTSPRTAPAAVEPSTHDACIAKRRAIEAEQTRQLDALRVPVKTAEADCAARLQELRAAEQVHWRVAEDYRLVAHQFDRQLAGSEAELRAIPMPAIDRFVEEMNVEIASLHRSGHRSRTQGTVVDGRGRRHPVLHTNYEGHRTLVSQLWAARQAAEALRYTATEAELPGEFQKLRDGLDYSLLEKFDGPKELSGDPVVA